TPIGNLGDVTRRALETLAQADLVAAEDTRVTRGLLAHFGIPARLVAVHAHNEVGSAERIVAAIAGGKAVALVSDAGTPGVSDPGRVVVERVRAAARRVRAGGRGPAGGFLERARSARGPRNPARRASREAGRRPRRHPHRRPPQRALRARPRAEEIMESESGVRVGSQRRDSDSRL